MNKFRRLEAGEIEVRVATIRQTGLSLLLYKDARVDQRLLDEIVGPENWQRSHEVIDGNLYCTVSIWDPEKKAWISKQDVGTESATEKEKGQASDSFKRACFNWGIGRELYSAPFIWINAADCNITTGNNGKPACYDRFSVKSIGYSEDGNITDLVVLNDKTHRVVYQMGKKEAQEPQAAPQAVPQAAPQQIRRISNDQMAKIYELANRTGTSLVAIVDYYKAPNLDSITWDQANEVIRSLSA